MDKPSEVLQGYALRDFQKAIEILRGAFERLWNEHEKAKAQLADREAEIERLQQVIKDIYLMRRQKGEI